MDLLLLSNGKLAGQKLVLEFARKAIAELVEKNGTRNFVLVPYAVVRDSYDKRVADLQATFDAFELDCKVIGLHTAEDPVQMIQNAEGIIVSGGNTWLLNKMLHDLGLVGVLRKRVMKENTPFIGWSAGCNIACPTIRTTNDMPIVTATILPSLNFIPFQINPHYIEASVSGHMGETRDERIEEFLIMNPHEPVVALPEGTWLHLNQGRLIFHSASNKAMKLFRFNQEISTFLEGADIEFLMNHSY